MLPVIPADRAGVHATAPVKHDGKDWQVAR